MGAHRYTHTHNQMNVIFISNEWQFSKANMNMQMRQEEKMGEKIMKTMHKKKDFYE